MVGWACGRRDSTHGTWISQRTLPWRRARCCRRTAAGTSGARARQGQRRRRDGVAVGQRRRAIARGRGRVPSAPSISCMGSSSHWSLAQLPRGPTCASHAHSPSNAESTCPAREDVQRAVATAVSTAHHTHLRSQDSDAGHVAPWPPARRSASGCPSRRAANARAGRSSSARRR